MGDELGGRENYRYGVAFVLSRSRDWLAHRIEDMRL